MLLNYLDTVKWISQRGELKTNLAYILYLYVGQRYELMLTNNLVIHESFSLWGYREEFSNYVVFWTDASHETIKFNAKHVRHSPKKTTAFDILNKECGIMYYKGIQHGNNSAKTCHYIVLRQVNLPYVTLFKKWGTQLCIILWTILSLFPKEDNMVIIVQKQVITLSSDKFINSS